MQCLPARCARASVVDNGISLSPVSLIIVVAVVFQEATRSAPHTTTNQPSWTLVVIALDVRGLQSLCFHWAVECTAPNSGHEELVHDFLPSLSFQRAAGNHCRAQG